jgi:hypothetical protein
MYIPLTDQLIYLSYSPIKNKKYRVILPDRTKIDFGDIRYEDYTIHKDPVRKERYLKRHFKREDWNDPYTKGFWSTRLLWTHDNLKDAIKDIQNLLLTKIIIY